MIVGAEAAPGYGRMSLKWVINIICPLRPLPAARTQPPT